MFFDSKPNAFPYLGRGAGVATAPAPGSDPCDGPWATRESGGCREALRALIAYADGMEQSRIDVVIQNGIILLTGVAANETARRRAVELASGFSTLRVVSQIAVRDGKPRLVRGLGIT